MSMRPWQIALLACLLVVIAGCVDPEKTAPEPPPVHGEALDLDRIFAQQEQPAGTLTLVDLVSGRSLLTEYRISASPSFAGNDVLVHSARTNTSQGIALTTVEENRTTTQMYEGEYSGDRAARFPSVDGDSVYFWVAPRDEVPKVIRRDVELGGEERVIATLQMDDQPNSPLSISPDGSFIAAGVESGGVDGSPLDVAVYSVSNGSFGSEAPVERTSGNHPSFVSESTLVFAHDGDIYLLDLGAETVSLLVPAADGEGLQTPVVAAGHLWFSAVMVTGDGDFEAEEIRRTTMDVDSVERIARSEEYFLGGYDVSPDGTTLAIDPTRPR